MPTFQEEFINSIARIQSYFTVKFTDHEQIREEFFKNENNHT